MRDNTKILRNIIFIAVVGLVCIPLYNTFNNTSAADYVIEPVQKDVYTPHATKVYTNDEYRFSFMYPADLTATSKGSNEAELQMEAGEQISGTVQPSFETVTFNNAEGEKQFQFEVFHANDTSLESEDYANKLYVYGGCDLRIFDARPAMTILTDGNGRALEVKTRLNNGSYMHCSYLKNADGNLIVFTFFGQTEAADEELRDTVMNSFALITTVKK